jgi:PAS domain S-box-containing protein
MMALDDLLDALPPSELPAQQAYQTLLNQVPAAVLVRDDFGRLRFVNQQAEALFGYTQAELLGAPIDVLIPERFRSRHRASRLAHREQTAVRTAGPDVAVPGLRKDGTEFPVDISLSPITLGGQRFVIDVVRDATAQQQGVQQRASLMRSLIRDLDRPLALVRGTLHLLQQATARGDMPSVEELREELAILAASADHVGAAVTELVDVAQGAAGQRTALVYHPMDLVALVREAVWVHQQIAPQRIAFQTQEAVLR